MTFVLGFMQKLSDNGYCCQAPGPGPGQVQVPAFEIIEATEGHFQFSQRFFPDLAVRITLMDFQNTI